MGKRYRSMHRKVNGKIREAGPGHSGPGRSRRPFPEKPRYARQGRTQMSFWGGTSRRDTCSRKE